MPMQNCLIASSFSSTSNLLRTTCVVILSLCTPVAIALPEGAQLTGGVANINQSANTLTIQQSSQQISIDYNSFNIAAGESVNFIQPDSQSIALNLVTGSGVSEIFGSLSANGQVFLINPNGILFASGAQVDVGGLFASTLSISNDDFFNQNFQLSNDATNASIKNYGQIQAGYVAFVSPVIENHGTITAEQINLHAADSVRVSFSPGIHIETLASSYQATIDNKGLLSADGGEVILTAASHNQLLETAINNDGVIEAGSLLEKEGRIFLIAEDQGDVINNGVISVSTVANDGNAGDILLEGERVAQLGQVHADGAGNGNGGQVHLLGDQVVALGSNSLTTANAGERGHGGEVIALSPETTLFHSNASIESKGGSISGDGGYVDVSGWQHVEVFGEVDVFATDGQHGTFLIDPINLTITGADFNSTESPADTFIPTATGATLSVGTLNAALTGGANIEVRTDVAGAEAGDLTIDGVTIDFDGNNGGSLLLFASGDMIFNANSQIIDSTPGDDAMDITLTAGGDIQFFDNTLIQTYGGNFAAVAGALFRVDPSSIGGNSLIDSGSGTLSITSGANMRVGGLLSTNATSSAITLNIGGDITDGVETYVDIVAPNGQTTINSNGTVPLETTMNDLAYTFNGGTVTIVNSSALNIVAGNNVGDINISNTVGNITVSGDIDTNGGDAGSLTLNASQDLNINAGIIIGDLTGADDNVDISLTAGNSLLMADGSLVDAVAGLIDVTTTVDAGISGLRTTNVSATAITINVSGNLTDAGDTIVNDLDAVNGGVSLTVNGSIGDLNAIETDINQASLNLTGSGNARLNESNNIEFTSVVNVTDFEVTTSTGTITIPDIGINASGDLIFSAVDIIDTDRTINLDGQNLNLNLTAAAGNVDINSTLVSIDASMSGANTNLRLTETDDITINSLTGITDFSLTAAAGTVTIPDAGLNVTGNIMLTTQDIIDADRAINISSQDLLLDVTAAAGDMAINTSVDRINIDFTGASGSTDLNITESNGIEVIDLGVNPPYALANTDGNISIDVTAGDLVINDGVIASDLTADGVRSGMIDFSVDVGDILIGNLRATTIESINTVDQNVGGGLDGNQVAVRIHNPDTGDLDTDIIIGDGVGNDVVMNVEGGDFQIDNTSVLALTGESTRNSLINSDVTIEVYNNLADPVTGTSSLQGVVNNGSLLVHSSRVISGESGQLFAITIEDIENSISSVVQETIESESESEVSSTAAVAQAETETPAQQVFNQVFQACDSSSSSYSKAQCSVETALQQYLQSLLIGGELPKVGNE